ncbi:hypothetical protein [Rhodococcus sp. MEB064]|uniref:hypothetical protein n=1 Tax=Rhodococcus sp. MEB064 TaxID=1587522 RepID=UPI0005ACDDE2|nr:hypothetical protein [Rhodococcus sp. MEB064]KIQ15338.1 hypothetical protein RU01_15515 [Rhodococcus sp. MEB064]
MASELAVAYVSILPETSRLVPEFNRQVGPGLERSGREQGQRYGNAFSGSAGKLVGAASGLLAGAAIVGFVNDSIKSLQRIERINTQTETVIASTGNAAKVSAGHVEDLAGELENLTATEAETIQQGANFLLTFKNIRNEVGDGNDIFDQTVGVMTDLSRATGTDMKAASLQLGKALNDPIKGISALARVGITFSAEQKKQIEGFVEVNDILSAQKIVLGELESQFGGSAEAYANTTEGKIELAKHALGTFGEAVTAQVLPPLAAIGTATATAFNGLAEHSDEVLALGAAFLAWRFIPPLLAQAGAAASGAAARIGAFATATSFAQTAAGRTQASVGRLSASMIVLSQQGGNVGRIGTAFVNASTGATRFATTAGAAAAAGKALQIAGGGIVSALGGPFGIAVLAAGAALFFWVKKNQQAKEAAEANSTAIKAISETLDAQTGAVTGATIAAQAKILADNGMIESARNYGIAGSDITAAHLGNEAALRKVNDVIAENISKSTESSKVYQNNAEAYSKVGVSLDDVTTALTEGGSAYDDVQGRIDNYNAKLKAAGANSSDLIPTLGQLRSSLDDSGNGAVDMAESIAKTNSQLTEAEAIQRDTALAMDLGGESASAFAEQMDVLSDSASSAEDRTNALKQALDALNGNPLDLEQANSQLQDAFQSTGEAVKPTDEGVAPSVNLDTNTIDVATEAGRKFLDVTIAQRDATLDAARAARDAAVANGDLSGAQQAATDVVEQSRQKFIEQVGTLGITGDAAQRLADKYIGIPSVVSTLIDQPNMAEKQLALDILKSKVDLVPDDKSITVETLDADAKARLEALGFTVTTLPDGKVEITANTANAQVAIDELIKPKTLPVVVDLDASAVDGLTARGVRVPGGRYADGAMVDYFAQGGLREDHVAQIAPAGAMRVWAEPETGGEGYIPLDPSKRARSTMILSQIATRFGMRLEKFADGGVVEAMRGIIAKRFPALTLTSGLRDEAGSYHGTGQAADFSNGSGNTAEQLAGANFVADNFPDSAELIYDDPGFDRQIKDGMPVDRSFYAGAGDHTNHFHWAMLNAPTDPDSAAAQNASGATLSERDQIVDKILLTGRARGFTDREIKSAVMAGLAESDLQNLDYGDRDSKGVFQQRPSQGWGTEEQVRDIDYATNKYYDALGAVADREKMTEAQMAQAVQRSAFSDGSNYQAKADEAQALIDAANSRTTTTPVTPESAADPASTSTTDSAASASGSTPETFSIKGRVQQLGSDLAGVAFDALSEQIPFGLGQSRWLTTDYPTFARKDIRIEEFDPEPPQGTPEHDEWMRRRQMGSVPVFDSGGIVRPGINIIDNQTGANEALANVTGLLTADPAPAGGVDNSLNIAKIEGANADEIMRRITQVMTRQHMRSSNRPF